MNKNEIQIFNEVFGEIRTIEENGKVLFCATDVARALGYSDTAKAIKTHCREDGWAIYPVIDSMGREQQAKFINEGNVYRLITHSKLPSAEKFGRISVKRQSSLISKKRRLLHICLNTSISIEISAKNLCRMPIKTTVYLKSRNALTTRPSGAAPKRS